MISTLKSSNGYLRSPNEQKSSSTHKEDNHNTASYQTPGPTQVNHHRHSTGKMKTTGYSSFTSHQDS